MLMLYITIFILLVMAVAGNLIAISALIYNDMPFIMENMHYVFVGGVADFILLCLAIKKAMPTLRMAIDGRRNLSYARKASADLTKSLGNVDPDIKRLEELRKKGISENSIKQTFRFCQLMKTIAGEGQLQECMAKVNERQLVLNEIYDIENRLFEIAESYRDAGDDEKCLYYLGLIKLKNERAKCAALEEECRDMRLRHYAEWRAMALCRKALLAALVILIVGVAALSAVSYYKNTFYG